MDTPKTRIRQLTRLLGVMIIAAALAACGSQEEPAEEDTVGSPTGTSSSEPSETPTAETTAPEEDTPMTEETTPYLDPSAGSTDKPGSSSSMTITGTVESGVEAGCLILEHEGTVYGIFGEYDKSVVYAGAEVTLSGYTDSGMMSFCQQGTPFVVEEAESAD